MTDVHFVHKLAPNAIVSVSFFGRMSTSVCTGKVSLKWLFSYNVFSDVTL